MFCEQLHSGSEFFNKNFKLYFYYYNNVVPRSKIQHDYKAFWELCLL